MGAVHAVRAGKCRALLLCGLCTALLLVLRCQRENAPKWLKLPVELRVEIAKTPEERQKGLMFRQHLPRDQGMYFVFEKEEQLSFYMRDTRVPLSIAFIGGNSVIESIKHLIPLDERSVYSDGPVRFALEVNRGWFDHNGIRPGDKVLLEGHRVSFFREAGR